MLTGLILVTLVVGSLIWAAASGSPVAAERPQLFASSLVLEDTRAALTVVNVATAQATVRLDKVNAQVGAKNDQGVQVVPVAGGTVLVNTDSGSFNYLDADNYVADPNGPAPPSTAATAPMVRRANSPRSWPHRTGPTVCTACACRSW